MKKVWKLSFLENVWMLNFLKKLKFLEKVWKLNLGFILPLTIFFFLLFSFNSKVSSFQETIDNDNPNKWLSDYIEQEITNYNDVFQFYQTCLLKTGKTNECVSQCFQKAGEFYHINPLLLWGIAYVESGFNPFAYNINKNRSVDRGIMQINSSWLPVLKKYGLKDINYLYHPCYNIYVGAWILRQCINKYGYSWKAVSCYNTGHPTKGMKYAKKVYNTIKHYIYVSESPSAFPKM
ncbi:MAG: lytic transglycosylase domain-containing protein [Candidatus Nanoarchaeia archaeon]